MRIWIVAASVLAACGGSAETSPAGPVGQTYDVRASLPPGAAAKAPTDDKATKHELAVDAHAVQAKLVWRTFDDGANKYIVSYAWEIVTPAPAITLEPLGNLAPTNAGTPDAAIESEIVRLRWHDHSSSGTHLGELTYKIDATGSGQPI